MTDPASKETPGSSAAGQVDELRDLRDLGDLEHLERLVGSWGMLADFAFADLLLFRPVNDRSWVVSAQIRPTTSRTLYPDDLVGTVVSGVERPLLNDARTLGAVVEANGVALGQDTPSRRIAIPVRRDGRVIAVVVREVALDAGRRPGRLERTYLEITERLAAMISDGTFPFTGADPDELDEQPRVGDGVILVDETRCVSYASPNAVSAVHRLGVQANVEGVRLSAVGIDESVVARAFARHRPSVTEIESAVEPGRVAAQSGLGVRQLAVGASASGAGASTDRDVSRSRPVILVRAIPLLESGRATGAVLLVRDVTEVRRRDRMLVSKDATIREVHHRVKNNLQTVSALLRLQGRRLESPEAKQAIEESVRRVRSIALVHETLSREIRETVPFDEVVRPLVRLVEEGLQTSERPVRFTVEGEVGDLAPEIATPLAVVLVELLQNAVEHAYPETSDTHGDANVRVALSATDQEIRVVVRDTGVGFPPGFSLSRSGSLGLTIARTLVTSELGGVIAARTDGGAVVEIRIPRR
jgi:two-component system, sensor histidine kinase PdtaS